MLQILFLAGAVGCLGLAVVLRHRRLVARASPPDADAPETPGVGELRSMAGYDPAAAEALVHAMALAKARLHAEARPGHLLAALMVQAGELQGVSGIESVEHELSAIIDAIPVEEVPTPRVGAALEELLRLADHLAVESIEPSHLLRALRHNDSPTGELARREELRFGDEPETGPAALLTGWLELGTVDPTQLEERIVAAASGASRSASVTVPVHLERHEDGHRARFEGIPARAFLQLARVLDPTDVFLRLPDEDVARLVPHETDEHVFTGLTWKGNRVQVHVPEDDFRIVGPSDPWIEEPRLMGERVRSFTIHVERGTGGAGWATPWEERDVGVVDTGVVADLLVEADQRMEQADAAAEATRRLAVVVDGLLQAHPEHAEPLEALITWGQRQVRAGYTTAPALLEALTTRAEPLQIQATALAGFVDAAFARQAQVQRTWTETTVNDRIERAFRALPGCGIDALEARGDDAVSGWAAVRAELRAAHAGHPEFDPHEGVVFFHGESIERALDGEGLTLTCGTFDPSRVGDTAQLAVIVEFTVDQLESHGVSVERVGRGSLHIPPFEWRKRQLL